MINYDVDNKSTVNQAALDETVEEKLEKYRVTFEEKTYQRYFTSMIKRNPSPKMGEMALGVPADILTKEQFLKRKENGHYDSKPIDSAWWGFRSGIAVALKLKISVVN